MTGTTWNFTHHLTLPLPFRGLPTNHPQVLSASRTTMQAFIPPACASKRSTQTLQQTTCPTRRTRAGPRTPRSKAAFPHACAETPPPSLAARIATAFIDACQPGRKPYAAALRDFCDTALAAYRAGYTLQALQFELSATSAGGAAWPVLQSDELELRSVWLTLVYKTLRKIGYPGKGGKGADGYDKIDDFVGNIVSAVRAGYDMKRIQLEQSLSQGNAERPRTTLESAILGQSTRLVVTTISAANDDLKGRDDRDGNARET